MVIQLKVCHRNTITFADFVLPLEQLLCLKKIIEQLYGCIGALLTFTALGGKVEISFIALKQVEAPVVEILHPA